MPCPTLLASIRHSDKVARQLSRETAHVTGVSRPTLCVVAVGSLGRLEVTGASDFDSVFIVPEGLRISERRLHTQIESVFACAARAGLKLPKADGIYRLPVREAELLSSTAHGSLSESPAVFGKRIQMLLDARALTGRGYFRQLQRRILRWYQTPSVRAQRPNPWEFLQRDLIRYANSYTNWQLAKYDVSHDDSWALRNAKLHTTRYLTWLGLWLLVLRAQREGKGAFDWVARALALTPLARVLGVIAEFDPAAAARLVQSYEIAFAVLSAPPTRARLTAQSRNQRDANELISELTRLAQTLREESEGFVLRNFRADCPHPRFGAIPF